MKNHTKELLLLTVIFLACFANSLSNDFAYDDYFFVKNNERINSPLNFKEVFLTDAWDGQNNTIYYRQLPLYTFSIDQYLMGNNPLAYRISNLFYSILLVWSVYFLLLMVTESKKISLIAASIFAVHPIHVECITFISGRVDIFHGLFCIVALLFYEVYNKKSQTKWLSWAYLAYLFALMSKETSLILLPLLILFDLTRSFDLKSIDWKKLLKNYIPFILITVGFFVFRSIVFSGLITQAGGTDNFGGYPDSASRPFADKFAMSMIFFGNYMKMNFIPIGLSMDYSFNHIEMPSTFFNYDTILSTIIIILICILAVLSWIKKQRITLIASIGLLMLTIPYSHVFPYFNVNMTDRYMLFASFMSSLMIAILFGNLLAKNKIVGLLVITIVLGIYGFLTFDRNLDWENNYMLYKSAATVCPNNARMQDNFGVELAKRKMYVEAEFRIKKALEIDPNLVNAYRNLSTLKFETNHFDEGIKVLYSALKKWPLYSEGYFTLAEQYKKIEDKSRLPKEYLEEYNINNSTSGSLCGIGRMFLANGDVTPAKYAFINATIIDKSNYRAYLMLGSFFLMVNKPQDSIEFLKRAIELNPQDPNVWIAFGNVSKKLSDRQNYTKCAEILFSMAKQAKDQGLSEESKKLAQEAYNLSKNDKYKEFINN